MDVPVSVDDLRNGDIRSVDATGRVTTLKNWRERVGVEAGENVLVRETDAGTLEIVPL